MGSRPDPDRLEFKQRLLQTIMRDAPVSYCILDGSYRVVFMNDYFLSLRKVDPGGLLGMKCYESANNGQLCPRCSVRDAMESGRTSKMLRKDIVRDGSIVYSDEIAVPIGGAGDGGYVLQILIDRTSEMRMLARTEAITLQMIDSLIDLLGEKDRYTCLHSKNVSTISAKFARYLGLDPHAVFSATLGGLLHDLGKLYIPDAVLKKPGRLTDAEYATIKEHPVFAWMLLAGLSTLKSISEVAIAHHEGWDGSGYPNGTAGEDIPLGARITAIADTYDAMTSDRPYRPALPHAEAVVEIKKSAGRRFDPRLAEKFIRMVEEWGFDRESLVAPLGALEATASEDYSLRWTPEAPPLRPADTGGLDRLLASGAFIDTALNNTPAFYSLVSEDYDVLYVSDNYAEFMGRPRRELLAGKCFEMVGKKEPCYMVDGAAGADGALCSVARAFATGERQYSLITEDIRGERLYYDNYAIPTELEGPGGERVRCCLEILFDRTAEKSVQRSFEGDLRHLMEKLRGMAEEVLPKDSENIRGITDETDRFIAYLDGAVSSISEPQWL